MPDLLGYSMVTRTIRYYLKINIYIKDVNVINININIAFTANFWGRLHKSFSSYACIKDILKIYEIETLKFKANMISLQFNSFSRCNYMICFISLMHN